MFAYAFAPRDGKGGGVPQLALTEIDGPFDVGGAGRRCRCRCCTATRPSSASASAASPISPTAASSPSPSYALLQGLDVLVLDALRHRQHPTHFTVAEATAAARRIGAAQTYFTHICHDLPHAETSANLPAGVALAHDGLVLEVDVAWPRRAVPDA